MAQEVPVNLTEWEKRDMFSGRPVHNLQTFTLQAAEVKTKFIYRPGHSKSSRSDEREHYAEIYREKEYEDFVKGAAAAADLETTKSCKSSTLEELEELFEDDSMRSEELMEIQIIDEDDEDDEDVENLYSRYNFRSSFDRNLPIMRFKDRILRTIEEKPVTIIQGSTGCGKSTQLCQYILDDFAGRSKRCNIVVTQPRRIAAISLAKRICAENEWDVGSMCGYQVGLDRVASNDTRLLICTIGVFLQKIITAKNLNEYTHVILDEVHDRSQDTDFCLLVVRRLIRTVSPNTKVILMSATLELPLYRDYLKYKTSDGLIEQPPVIRITGDTFDITEMYLDDLSMYGQVPERDSECEPMMHDQLMRMAVNLILSFTEEERGALMAGSVLVFLPGLEHIEDMKSMLEPYSKEHNLVLRLLHSSVPSEEQAKVFERMRPGQRKVILSTNIAESSITVADVKYVIDFCLTKSMMFNTNSNYSSLQLQWASKSSCAQRKGRAGRVADGIVYRMVEYQFFQRLEDFDKPEILTNPLDRLVLKSKLIDMGNPKEVLALALTPPDLRNIEKTILMLKEEGALSPLTTDVHDGSLTFMGEVLASLPIDTRMGKLILLGYVVGLLEEAMVISALHSVPSIFVFPNHSRLEAYQNKMKWSNDTNCDSLTSYFAYKAWEHLKAIERFANFQEEYFWCRKHFMDLKRLKEVKILTEELRRRLSKDFNISVPQGQRHLDLQQPNDQFLLKVILCGAFYPNYFVSSNLDEPTCMRTMNGHDPLRTILLRGFPDGGGVFYKKHLKSLFEKCDPLGCDMRIHPENTRVYIEFVSKDPNQQSTLAVCSALKMRQLKMKLEVNPDVSALVEHDDDDVVCHGNSARKGHVELPSLETTIIAITITEVIDCGHFWASYWDDKHRRQNAEMHRAIQSHVQSSRAQLSDTEARIGCYCIAPYTDSDEEVRYYRARIVGRSAGTVKVFFVDFGNYLNVEIKDIYRLDDRFMSHPFQAMEFKLVNIKPSPLRNFDSNWSVGAKRQFECIVNNNESFVCNVFSIVDNVVRVEMAPFDHPDDDDADADVGRRLIHDGHAEYCEESCASKENNMLRGCAPVPSRTIKHMLMDADDQLEAYERTPSQSKNWDNLIKSRELNRAWEIKRSNQLHKVTVVGPTNSYEINFRSLITSYPGRLVVDRTSVNSVLVTSEVSNPIPSMMAAAFVRISPSGSGLIIRESTVLPKVRGLLPLLTLLFSPIAEYRTDKEKIRYTGALCGLGSLDGEPVFAENDIELTFDMDFDFEDIKLINEIRISMNLVIGRKMNWSTANLLKVQSVIRRKIYSLLRKPRGACEPEGFAFPLFWNKVDERDVIISKEGDGTFFTPHPGIALRTHLLEQLQQRGPLTPELRNLHHNMLLKKTAQTSMDEVFHCLICQESIVGTPRLSMHLNLKSHLRLLRP